jgi:hypothetical protein
MGTDAHHIRNPPARSGADINARFARIEIIESIAVVHLEVQRWSGKLAGTMPGF